MKRFLLLTLSAVLFVQGCGTLKGALDDSAFVLNSLSSNITTE